MRDFGVGDLATIASEVYTTCGVPSNPLSHSHTAADCRTAVVAYFNNKKNTDATNPYRTSIYDAAIQALSAGGAKANAGTLA